MGGARICGGGPARPALANLQLCALPRQGTAGGTGSGGVPRQAFFCKENPACSPASRPPFRPPCAAAEPQAQGLSHGFAAQTQKCALPTPLLGIVVPADAGKVFKSEAFPLALPRIFEAQGCPRVRCRHGTAGDGDDRARGCPEGSGFSAGAFAVLGGRAFKRSPRPRGSRRKGDHPCPRRIFHARSRRPSPGFTGAMGAGSGRRWSVRIAVIRRRSSPSASKRRRRSSIVASN